MTELTKKDAFTWDEETRAALEELKRRVTSAPILAMPSFEEELVECDASNLQIEATLMQNKHPILQGLGSEEPK